VVPIARWARILGLAGRDEVLVSATTGDLLEGSGLEDAGVHELKGVLGRSRPVVGH